MRDTVANYALLSHKCETLQLPATHWSHGVVQRTKPICAQTGQNALLLSLSLIHTYTQYTPPHTHILKI